MIIITYKLSGYSDDGYWKETKKPFAVFVNGKELASKSGRIRTFTTLENAKKAAFRTTSEKSEFTLQTGRFNSCKRADKWWKN